MSTPFVENKRKALGAQIRQARKDAGHVSMESFAREIGVSWITVSRWERGVSEISVDRLGQIADALGVSIERLLERKAA